METACEILFSIQWLYCILVAITFTEQPAIAFVFYTVFLAFAVGAGIYL